MVICDVLLLLFPYSYVMRFVAVVSLWYDMRFVLLFAYRGDHARYALCCCCSRIVMICRFLLSFLYSYDIRFVVVVPVYNVYMRLVVVVLV